MKYTSLQGWLSIANGVRKQARNSINNTLGDYRKGLVHLCLSHSVATEQTGRGVVLWTFDRIVEVKGEREGTQIRDGSMEVGIDGRMLTET